MPLPTFARRWSTWPRAAIAAGVFAVLDVVDALLCLVYALLDALLEDSPVRCYCHQVAHPEEDEVSDTLYVRRSAIRDALLRLARPLVGRRRAPPRCSTKWRSPRWSDCACKSCVAWRGAGGRLHVVVKEPDPSSIIIDMPATNANACRLFADAAATLTSTTENAVFIHGFTSSSSFWAETVFHESGMVANTRLLAVDLLGFGQSPKPANCMYRLKDHVEAIERTLIEPPHNLSSFHLVAHSMGCIIALALAAKHPTRVKSITLLAPPYFLPCEQKPSQVALSRLAEKKLWPPLLFGSAVMSWYEHIGRTVCFLLCKNHLLWEWIIKLLRRKRDVDFRLRDLTRHTHHSAWHTMHNVICGGAALQDANLDAVQAAGIPVMVIHGVEDTVVPVECSRHLKAKLPRAELRLVHGCDHTTVLSGRERSFAQELTAFWSAGLLGSHQDLGCARRQQVNGGC